MADVTDVANALVSVIAGVVYPNGTTQPSITNCPILVYQGWPVAQTLDTDLKAGTVHISVFPKPGDRVTSVMSGDGEWDEQSNNGTLGVLARELRRQTRTFQITIWANCFDSRDPVAASVDSALAGLSRLALPDQTQGIVTYVSSTQDDSGQTSGVYRRDLFYAVNYATIQTDTGYTIKELDTSLRSVVSASDPSSANLGPQITVGLTATNITTTVTP